MAGQRVYSGSNEVYPTAATGGGGGVWSPLTITGEEDSATLQGGAALTGGKLVLGVANTDYATQADRPALDKQAGTSMGWRAMINPTAVSGTQTVFGKHSGASAYNGYVLQLLGTQLEVYMNDGGGAGTKIQWDVDLEAGEDVAIVVNITDDGAGNLTIQMFVNGKSWGTGSVGPADDPPDTGNTFYLGCQYDGTSTYNGYVGDIWNVEIRNTGVYTQQEIDDYAMTMLYER